MGSLYLGGPTIQEVDGKMMMDLSIYGGAVISGSLYSRFYGIRVVIIHVHHKKHTCTCIRAAFFFSEKKKVVWVSCLALFSI